jgi:hypothetical protein
MLAMAGLAAAVETDHSRAIGFGMAGTLLLVLGALAGLSRRSAHESGVAPNRDTAVNYDTGVAAVCWVLLYGLMLATILTEPAMLHRAFGVEAFRLPVEYLVPPVLAVLLLPLWPGLMGIAGLLRTKGRAGLLGIALELRSALASGDSETRHIALKALWFFAYLILLMAGWIAYAETIGV